MIKQMRWIDRQFDFNTPVFVFPSVLERLRGTPVRIEEMVRDIPEELLRKEPEHGWSIQEHIGHLNDVNFLFDSRIDDFLQGVETLREADMSNPMTEEANHNSRDLDIILSELRSKRNNFVSRLESMDEITIGKASLHPRLKVPMRPVDMAIFVAEHDDNHIAMMRALSRELS